MKQSFSYEMDVFHFDRFFELTPQPTDFSQFSIFFIFLHIFCLLIYFLICKS